MKIYDEEVQKYLRDSGVSESEINKIKYRELREMVLNVLNQTQIFIENEDYSKIETVFSPAGDGWGEENYYLSFDGWDIQQVLDELTILKSLRDDEN